MSKFRVMTDRYSWTVKDTVQDPTVFLGNHFYKSPTSGTNFIVIDDAIISLDKIIAIEMIEKV